MWERVERKGRNKELQKEVKENKSQKRGKDERARGKRSNGREKRKSVNEEGRKKFMKGEEHEKKNAWDVTEGHARGRKLFHEKGEKEEGSKN